MKNRKEFETWIKMLRDGYGDNFNIFSEKDSPPYPMFHDDGTQVDKINIKWICKNSGNVFNIIW